MQRDRAVFVISVAAELAGVHPQTLRIYERKGLLRPHRTAGNTRRYSEDDIRRLQRIQYLTQGLGINLAGAKMILDLEQQLERMRGDLERVAGHARTLEARLATASPPGAILPASHHRTLQEFFIERSAEAL